MTNKTVANENVAVEVTDNGMAGAGKKEKEVPGISGNQ